MFKLPPSLKRPYVDDDRLYQFVNLDGVLEVFDIEVPLAVKASGDDGVWYGRDVATRGDEVLYRIAEDRWVLVFVTFPGDEHDATPDPVNRELSPAEAARWLRLNKHSLLRELRTAIVEETDEREKGENRLDRAWEPSIRRQRPTTEVAAVQRPSTLTGCSARLDPALSIDSSSRNTRNRGDLELQAVALLFKHPDWTNKRIADELNCHPKSLSRFKKFRQARSGIKSGRNEFPRGRKDGKTGSIEAWDDE